MRARFFNNQVATSFVSGFIGGFKFSQYKNAFIEIDNSFRDASALKVLPVLITAFSLSLAAFNRDFRLNHVPEHVLSSTLGFVLGSYLGNQVFEATPSISRKSRP